MLKRLGPILIALLAGLLVGGLVVGAGRFGDLFGGGSDPETVTSATLQSVREQSRLTPFAARFVAVVTSTQNRFGLSARKTLIMPGMVRYEIDLARLRQEDLSWNARTRQLRITLPPLLVTAPQVNLDELQEYGGDGVLSALTDAEQELDAVNRRRGQLELIRQARQPLPVRLARDAARRAVERSFAMPLRAAGIEAEVIARFPDEAGEQPSYLDRSRRIEEVVENQAAGAAR
jgi:hypothetical protein